MAPHRLEAHAASARAYEQVGQEQQAIESWGKAVGAENVDPVWRYQYGKLLFVNQRVAEAREQLEKAVAGAKSSTGAEGKSPTWLPDAQRYLAMSIGKHKDAIVHWQEYLKARQGTNEPYIREALDALNQILAISGN
jgi:tetratricopeptide (TPR) repeat protein